MHRDTAARFARWARERDPADLEVVFDATAAELFRLALHLTTTEADAEDLLQATFLSAMQQAGRFDSQRPLKPWLCGILSNLARRQAAARRRRPVVRAETVEPHPADTAAKRELWRTLRRAIARLRHRDRELLQLRLLDGLTTTAIAAQLERSPGTVRVQIHRGLDRLRRLLPRGVALSGLGLPADGLATVRSAVLSAAGTTYPGTLWISLGMKLKLAIAGGVALLLGAWLVLRIAASPDHLDRAGPESTVGQHRAVSSAEPSGRVDEPIGVQRASVETAPRADDPLASSATLIVRVRWDGDGSAAEGVGVRVAARNGRDPRFATYDELTGPDGIARFDELTPGSVVVELDRGARVALVLAEGASSTELRVPSGVDVHGEVVDEAGRPVAGASVYYGPPLAAHADTALQAVTRTDAAGRFSLRALAVPGALSARARGHGHSRVRYLTVLGGRKQARVRLVVNGVGFRLRGRVVDGDGESVHRAIVALGDEAVARPRRAPDGSYDRDWRRAFARTDSDGVFEIGSLREGTTVVRIESSAHAPYRTTVEVPAMDEPTFVLQAGGVVVGSVTDHAGNPIAAARVAWLRPSAKVEVHTDATGSFRLNGLPQTTLPLEVSADGFASQSIELTAGRQLRWDPVLEPMPMLSGFVVDEREQPLANVEISAWPRIGRPIRAATNDDGMFRAFVSPEQVYRLQLREPNSPVRVPCDDAGEVRAGDNCRIVVADRFRATAGVTGIAIGPGGRPLGGAWLKLRAVEASFPVIVGHLPPVSQGSEPSVREAWLRLLGDTFVSSVGQTDWHTGAFALEPLPPGRYALQVQPATPDAPPLVVGPFDLTAGESRDLGTLIAPAPGELLFTFARTDGGAIPRMNASVLPVSGGDPIRLACVEGSVTRRALAPGEYELSAFGEGFVRVRQFPLTIR